MAHNEIKLENLFKIDSKDGISKRYYQKHAVFWNTKQGYYERFSLQIFRSLDERGQEDLEGMWIGEYNRRPQQLGYLDLFKEVDRCRLEPVLIIWECFEAYKVKITEYSSTGRRNIEPILEHQNSDKFK